MRKHVEHILYNLVPTRVRQYKPLLLSTPGTSPPPSLLKFIYPLVLSNDMYSLFELPLVWSWGQGLEPYYIHCSLIMLPLLSLKSNMHNETSCLYTYRVIRLTTPILNYVIISGSLLMYLSVFCGLIPAAHKESLFRAQCFVSYNKYQTWNEVHHSKVLYRSIPGCMALGIFWCMEQH